MFAQNPSFRREFRAEWLPLYDRIDRPRLMARLDQAGRDAARDFFGIALDDFHLVTEIEGAINEA